MTSLRLPRPSWRSADRPKRGVSVPLRECRVRSSAREPRDGFADFFGYDLDRADALPAKARPRDGFEDFLGYPEDDAALPVDLHAVFLPDRDPVSPRSADAGEGLARIDRQWADATEASLGLIRAQIESKRKLLRSASGDAAEELRKEVHRLKLQQARLAEALWHCCDEGQAAPPKWHLDMLERQGP